jgi:uncharacterized membrane protein YkvA (DUF1232 family)
MPDWHVLVIPTLTALVLYAGAVLALVSVRRRADAVAVARFVPDCVVMFRRLLGDRRISRWRKLLLALVLLYLVNPIDLVPDFIPIAGALDDAIVVAVAVRAVLHGAGPVLLREHWPGPSRSLDAVVRLV